MLSRKGFEDTDEGICELTVDMFEETLANFIRVGGIGLLPLLLALAIQSVQSSPEPR